MRVDFRTIGVRRNVRFNNVLATLNGVGGVEHKVSGINVPIDNVVSQLVGIIQASGRAGTASVWWAHVFGDESKDIAEGHFVIDELLLTDFRGYLG